MELGEIRVPRKSAWFKRDTKQKSSPSHFNWVICLFLNVLGLRTCWEWCRDVGVDFGVNLKASFCSVSQQPVVVCSGVCTHDGVSLGGDIAQFNFQVFITTGREEIWLTCIDVTDRSFLQRFSVGFFPPGHVKKTLLTCETFPLVRQVSLLIGHSDVIRVLMIQTQRTLLLSYEGL